MDSPYYRKKKKLVDLRAILRRFLRNRRAVVTAIIGIPMALYLLFGSHGVIQRMRLQSEKAELEAKIRDAEAETKRLQEESKALDSDMKAIEKVAREKYGMVREGETLYRVNKKQ